MSVAVIVIIATFFFLIKVDLSLLSQQRVQGATREPEAPG